MIAYRDARGIRTFRVVHGGGKLVGRVVYVKKISGAFDIDLNFANLD